MKSEANRTAPATRGLRRGFALAAFVALAGVAYSPAAAAAEVPAVRKIAMVDMQRVINETKAGIKARKELESSGKSKQEKVDKKRTKLEADAAKLEGLSGQKLAEAQEKLQQDSMELQSMVMTLEQELGDQHNKLLEKMYKNSQEIVGKMAKDKGLDLVLVRDSMTVIYAKDGFDITAEVVKAYDATPKYQ